MTDKEYMLCKFNEAQKLFPPQLRSKLERLPEADKRYCEEIRLRAGRGLSVLLPEGETLLTGDVTQAELEALIEYATEASAHSARESLKSGYITASGGHRIGVCGAAIIKEGEVAGFRSVSSLAVRIAREVRGVATELISGIYENRRFRSCLIISPPGGGKTTLLRDLIRLISYAGARVSVADERGEIAALRNGVPQMDVGPRTDVMEHCPRAEAVLFLIRAMNPEVVAMDEVMGRDDAAALLSAAGCGAGMIATAHASSFKEAAGKKIFADMLGIFERVITIRMEHGKRIYQTER